MVGWRWVAILVLFGCGVRSSPGGSATSAGESSSSTGSEQACEPGTPAECWCPEANKGSMVCTDQGEWPPCNCPDVCAEGQVECPDETCVDEEDGGFVPLNPCCEHGLECACDPGQQDCPEGEKCTAYVEMPGSSNVDGNRCMPVIGDQQLGDACTREADNDDCARGLYCLVGTAPGKTGTGRCIPYCDVNAQEPCVRDWVDWPDGACIVYADGLWPHCVLPCDPLAADCAGGEVCVPWGDAPFACFPEDQPGAVGDPCVWFHDCGPGLSCYNADALESCDASACCSPYCDCTDPDAPECTTPGEVCECWYEGQVAPEGYERLGVCAIPD